MPPRAHRHAARGAHCLHRANKAETPSSRWRGAGFHLCMGPRMLGWIMPAGGPFTAGFLPEEQVRDAGLELKGRHCSVHKHGAAVTRALRGPWERECEAEAKQRAVQRYIGRRSPALRRPRPPTVHAVRRFEQSNVHACTTNRIAASSRRLELLLHGHASAARTCKIFCVMSPPTHSSAAYAPLPPASQPKSRQQRRRSLAAPPHPLPAPRLRSYHTNNTDTPSTGTTRGALMHTAWRGMGRTL